MVLRCGRGMVLNTALVLWGCVLAFTVYWTDGCMVRGWGLVIGLRYADGDEYHDFRGVLD